MTGTTAAAPDREGPADVGPRALSRYSHRIALSDSRILDFDDGQVSLSYRDYRDGDQRKVMTLTGEELLRRFLLHVLPKGFMRVRHFGFLANRCSAQRLAAIRTALAAPAPEIAATPAETGSFDGYPCPPDAAPEGCM